MRCSKVALEVRPYVLTAKQEQALKPGDSFKECAGDCPDMVVVPAGSFLMGSLATEKGHRPDEEPQHVDSLEKVLDRLATSEKTTIVVERAGRQNESDIKLLGAARR
jgi:hypothetical protein